MLTQISREEFRQKYLLGRQVSHEGVRSFEARDTADRTVLVHLLGAVDGPDAVPWLAALSALTPERRSGLLGAFQIDREAVLVTAFLPQVRSLAEWFVASAGSRKATDQASAEQDGNITSVEPGSTTAGATTDPESAGLADHPSEVPARAEDASTSQDAGEFSRMFASDNHDSVSAPVDEVPTEIMPRLDDPADSKSQPAGGVGQQQVQQPDKGHGEFTRMFGAQQADSPAPPTEPPAEQKPTVTAESSDTAGSEPDQKASEFTVFFGAEEKAGVDPQRSQTPITQPSPTGPPRQPAKPGRPDEKRKAGPRIVWRDQKSKAVPPEPEQPKITIRLAKDSPPEETGQAVRPQAPPPGPAPSQPPGQFTEIFGRALPPESAPSYPGTGGAPKGEQPADTKPPPFETSPRKSIGDQRAPLSGSTSSDYLRALGYDSQAAPPPAAPAPEPVKDKYEYSPDLPPPVSEPHPQPAPGPGDYTRVVSGRPAVPPPAASAPGPGPGPRKESRESAPTKAPTWLWVALVAIVLVMVLLIVLVVLT